MDIRETRKINIQTNNNKSKHIIRCMSALYFFAVSQNLPNMYGKVERNFTLEIKTFFQKKNGLSQMKFSMVKMFAAFPIKLSIPLTD